MSDPRRRGGGVFLAWPVLLATLAAFAGVLTGGALYFRDLALVHRPVRMVVRRLWAAGQLPLWDPAQDGGRWLLANPNHRVLHPSALLDLFLSVDTALAVAAILQVFIAGWGAALLMREWGATAGASRITGVAYALSGPILSLGNLPNLMASIPWVPLILLATLRSWQRPIWTPLAAALAAVPLLAGGVESWGAATLWLGLLAVWDRSPGRRQRLLRTAAVMAGGALIAGAQVLPAWFALAGSERGIGFRPSQIFHWSLSPLRLLESVIPRLWGLPTDPSAWWGGAMFDGGLPLILSAYIGAPVAALAIYAATLLARRRTDQLPPALVRGLLTGGLLGACGVLLALGRYNPLLVLAGDLPVAGAVLRYPERLFPLAILPVALMAGAGWQALMRHPGTGRWSVSFLASAAAVMGVIVALTAAACSGLLVGIDLDPARVAGGPMILMKAALMALAALAALVACVWLGRGRDRGPLPAGLAAVIIAFDLLLANAAVNPTANRSLLDETPEVVTFLRQAAAGSTPRLLRHPEPLVRGEGIPPGVEVAWSRRSLSAGTPLEFGLSTALIRDMDRSAPLGNAFLRTAHDHATGARAARLADRAGADWEISFEEEEAAAPAAFARRVFPGAPPVVLRSRPQAAAIVQLLPRGRPAGDLGHPGVLERTLGLISDPETDPALEVVLSVHEAPVVDGGFQPREGSAVILRRSPVSVLIRTAAPGEGVLVLRESYAAGWSARVNGMAAPILRADLAWRAVVVPPGTHEVEFTYRQPGWIPGLVATLAGLLGVAIFPVLARRRLAGAAVKPA